MDDACQHNWVYGGLKWHNTGNRIAGRSAEEIDYYDWFYCSGCLQNRYRKLDIVMTNFDKVIEGASPMPRWKKPEELLQ
jgi:hypothetical protein